MRGEKLFTYFTGGIAMIVALYEICRTGKRNRHTKIK